MATVCCEARAPITLGDTAWTIVIEAGMPNTVEGFFITAEGCDCAYDDDYIDEYCDPSEGGAYPNARIPSAEYTIGSIPAGTVLTIDAVDRTVKITQDQGQIGGIDAVDFPGLFEWIEAAGGGCVSVCVNPSLGTLNADTTVTITTTDREL